MYAVRFVGYKYLVFVTYKIQRAFKETMRVAQERMFFLIINLMT